MEDIIAIQTFDTNPVFYGKFKREPVAIISGFRVYELADFYREKGEAIEVRQGRAGELTGKYSHLAIKGHDEPLHQSTVEVWVCDPIKKGLIQVLSYQALFYISGLPLIPIPMKG